MEYTFYFFIKNRAPKPSILGPDPSQTLNYTLQLRSVQFLASGVRQVSRSRCPQQPDAKRWFCVAGGGGQAPPHLRHKTLVQHIQDLHYANLWFCVAGGGGQAPPLLRNTTTVLRRKQSSRPKFII